MPTKKRLLVDKGRPHGTVILNWHGTPEREFSYFAEAYRLVAQEAAEGLRDNPHFGVDGIPVEDFRAYPVVFLYRHSLELYMKAVILVGSPMLSIKGMAKVDRKRILSIHYLDELFQNLEGIFKAYGWKWDLGTRHFQTKADFRKTILELHAVDKLSDTFRYPLNTKGGASLPSHFRFDLFEFCQVLDGLLAGLEGATICAYEELQITMEARSETRQWEMEDTNHDSHD
jgi:hypothetical protein